jgi:hypothetical protein
MNWKLVIIGGIVFWLVTNILGMLVTGTLIHEKILDAVYQANESFCLPELRQDSPDMAALVPRWLLTSFVSSLVVAGIYSLVGGSFGGPGWSRGLKWGLCLGIFSAMSYFAMSGVFDLPLQMWIWWSIDALILFILGGAAMGWAAERFAGS